MVSVVRQPDQRTDQATAADMRIPFVGRDAELAGFGKTLDQVAAGRSRAVEITGEPGIGKTRLLDQFGRLARARGFLVRAVAEAQLADRHLVAPRLGVDPADPAAGGLVLLLDDMHRADEATIDTLARVIRSGLPEPLLLVIAHRHRQTPVQLHSAITGHGGALPVHRIHLGPITERDAEALLDTRHTRSWRRAIYRHSKGNPFYLGILALAATGPQRTGAVVLGELPHAARMAVIQELELLSSLARTVIDAAAVAGDDFDVDLVAQITQDAEAAVRTALDELAHLDLIRPAADGQQLTFRHSLIRQAVYDATSLGWRLTAHVRATEALRRRGAPPMALARHIEQTATPGDSDAVALLNRAALAVQTRKPALAVGWLRVALRLLPERGGCHRRRTALLVRLGQLLGLTGNLRESRDVLHEALRLLPRTPTAARAQAAAFCVLVERLMSRRVEAGALARAELAALPAGHDVARAALVFELACIELAGGEPAACRELALSTLAAARRYHVRPAQAASLGLLALASMSMMDTGTARTHLDAAATLLDSMLDGDLVRSLRAAAWVIGAEVLQERWDDALRHLDRAVSVAQHSGHVLFLPHLYACRMLALRARGRLAEARDCAELAADLGAASGSDWEIAIARIMRHWIGAHIGDGGEMVDGAVIAGVVRPAISDGLFSMVAWRLLAEVRLATGDVAGCLALAAVAGGDDLPAVDVPSRAAWYEIMTRAELAAGRLAAAAGWADRAGAAAAPLNLPGQAGLALLARAQALAASDPALALDAGTRAVQKLGEAGMVLDAARARLASASPLAMLGRFDEAHREVTAAHAAFESFGAHPLARQAIVERRRLAARSSRRERAAELAPASAALNGLTRRERQVAALVGEGLTNRRVAQQLFVTEKTVEMHLANIFAKLGVSSRASVAHIIGTTDGAKAAATASPLPSGIDPRR